MTGQPKGSSHEHGKLYEENTIDFSGRGLKCQTIFTFVLLKLWALAAQIASSFLDIIVRKFPITNIPAFKLGVNGNSLSICVYLSYPPGHYFLIMFPAV